MRWLESLIAMAMLGGLLASWTLWSRACLRFYRRKPLLAAEPRKDVPWGALDLAISLVLLLVVPFLALKGVEVATGLIPADADKMTPAGYRAVMLTGSLGSLVVVALAMALARWRTGATWKDLGIEPDRTAEDVPLGAAAFFMLAPLVYGVMLVLVQWFPSEHPLIKLVKEDDRLFASAFFVAVIVAPIAEEFLFRVLLQGWLEKVARKLSHRPAPVSATDAIPESALPEILGVPHFSAQPVAPDNPYAPPLSALPDQPIAAQLAREAAGAVPPIAPPFWPVLVSSAIFAALHAGHGPDPIPLFVLAVGLGYLYRQTHRVLPGIVVHMLLNGLSMGVLWLSLKYGLGT